MTTEQRLAEMRDHVTKAEKTVEVLCNGGRWTMSIPARLNDDPDIIISRALADAKTLIKESAEREEKIARLRSALLWALGEEGEFSKTPDGLLYLIGEGGRAIRRRGEDVPIPRLYWWRSELRERAFGPADPPSTNSPALEETKTNG